MSKRLKELLKMASDIEPSFSLSQELVVLAYEAGKKDLLKKGLRVNATLNNKRQVRYITNYQCNATVIMDE